MYKHGIDDVAYSTAREVVYEQVKWTEAERAFRERAEVRDRLKLSTCLERAVVRSSLGAILRVPRADRADMLEMSRRGLCTSPGNGRDYFADDFRCLLEKAMNLRGDLTEDVAYGMFTNLRLVNRGITDVDAFLAKLKNLRFLSLTGNAIRRICGACLPRRLTFLELYQNELEEVRSLSQSLPASLMHLGLARNKLKDNSGLELLGKNRKLSLRTLDLEDNNIVNLVRLLHGLSNLKRLSALKLAGNPCSLCYTYHEAVALYCPTLLLLDDVAFSTRQKDEPDTSDRSFLTGTKHGTFCFFCFQISGLEEPKDAMPIQSGYHIEVELPLFDPVKRLEIINNILAEREKATEDEEEDIEEEQQGEQEDQEEDEEVKKGSVLAFRSPRVSWSEVMEFPEPCIRVRVPQFAGLTELRDTFRSTVTVRIRHTKFVETEPTDPCDVDTEKILSEATIAEFDADLEQPPWCVSCLKYEWTAGSRKATPISVTPGDEKKGSLEGENPSAAKSPLTCRVGFGVQRTLPDSDRDAIH